MSTFARKPFQAPRPFTRSKPKSTKKLDIVWHRVVEPREQYRIVYADKAGDRTERDIVLTKQGTFDGHDYLGVIHGGIFKSFRADRVVDVLAQLTPALGFPGGHAPSLRAHLQVDYATPLPAFPKLADDQPAPRLRIPTLKGSRSWMVDLATYVCACPQKRIRDAMGYRPGVVGAVCPHMARAILQQLPAANDWPPELLAFLRIPTNTAIENLV